MMALGVLFGFEERLWMAVFEAQALRRRSTRGPDVKRRSDPRCPGSHASHGKWYPHVLFWGLIVESRPGNVGGRARIVVESSCCPMRPANAGEWDSWRELARPDGRVGSFAGAKLLRRKLLASVDTVALTHSISPPLVFGCPGLEPIPSDCANAPTCRVGARVPASRRVTGQLCQF